MKLGFSANHIWQGSSTLWTQEQPSFEGKFVSFPKVYSCPKPHRKPHPPVLIGAGNHNTDNARILERVVEDGDGWPPVFLSPRQMREARDLIAEYEDAGVQRILVGLVDLTREGGLKTVEEAAKGLGLI